MDRIIIPAYMQEEKIDGIFCGDCKPKGKSVAINLVVGEYDNFCYGCGESFVDIAARKASKNHE